LLSGRVHEQTLRGLFRGELLTAAKNGVIAAVVVALVVGYRGIDLPIVLGSTVGAFVLGVLLHQVLLIAGALVIRARATASL
jgi:hypothetical protein